jgi:non-ribosomal peptide synthetase component F
MLPRELRTQLATLSRREGVTLYMAFLAAFQVLLNRYTGQEDIAVGTPIAGRTRSDVESLVGLFVNTLVLRADLSGDPSFRALLKQVRLRTLEAYAHQDLPFDRLVEALHPDRDPGRSPLFSVMFALQNAPLPIPQTPELALTQIEPDTGTAKFDLTLFASEVDAGIALSAEYDTDIFEAATIDRLLRHLGTVIEEVVKDPDQPIGNLTLLSAAERQQLLGQGQGDGLRATLEDVPADLDQLDDEQLDELLSRFE